VRIEILTLFPDYFRSPLGASLLGKGIERGRVEIVVTDIRDFAPLPHRVVDDAPYGGGEGMVMKPEPVVAAIEAAWARCPGARRILLSPRGRRFAQEVARQLAALPGLILVCGRYEGVDERVLRYVDEELSIGDYVLAGGEAAALVVVDAVVRLVPGVVGNAASLEEESFQGGLLEYPQYTRPETFRGQRVPEVLRSGDHAAIARWRRKERLRVTRARRPDLLARARLDEEDRRLLAEIEAEEGSGGRSEGD
jgi:tRNA (guanine37-N1)-methyltransferase